MAGRTAMRFWSPRRPTSRSNVIKHNGLTPVFVNVEPTYYGIDPVKLEEKISPRTRAIMPVHLAGHPCDMSPSGPQPRSMV